MSRQDIIIELVMSLNKGDTMTHKDRVNIAILQYNQMVDAGIIAGQPICIDHEPKNKIKVGD